MKEKIKEAKARSQFLGVSPSFGLKTETQLKHNSSPVEPEWVSFLSTLTSGCVSSQHHQEERLQSVCGPDGALAP